MIALIALLAVVGSPMWLMLFYALFIQHERGGWWRAFAIFGIAGWPLDFALNYTLFAGLFRAFPEAGAYTFSKQLEWLQQRKGWRGEVSRPIVDLLNAIAPSGRHIKQRPGKAEA